MLTSARNKPSESSSFHMAAPGDLLIPQKLILRTIQEVIREKRASLLRYYPSNRLYELRKQISFRWQVTDVYLILMNLYYRRSIAGIDHCLKCSNRSRRYRSCRKSVCVFGFGGCSESGIKNNRDSCALRKWF